MAKPRVFVSSTYYDLKHIRNSLEGFIEGLGYDAVLFESGDIPVLHDTPVDESCYGEISNCHMLVLIIGGRYGGAASETEKLTPEEEKKVYETYNSITKKEYQTARERDIPIFIFVEKNVLAEYQTFKGNRDNTTIIYHHVDSINIYHLLDEILAQRRNNFVKDFEKFDDIASWLRVQWAGLFADFLTKKSSETTLKDLASQIHSLGQVSGTLKTYTESIMRKVQPEDFETIISRQENQLRASRVRRFRREDMISFLLRHDEEGKTTPSGLFAILENSSSLTDFLEKARFTDEFVAGFMESHGVVAKRDYETLMDRYVRQTALDDVDDTDDIDE